MTDEKIEYEKNFIIAAFEQLMEHVRRQEELVHSWTKYYLSIQAALAIAISYLISLGPMQGTFVNIGLIFIPFLGITTSICITSIIHREQKWQGRYIMQIGSLHQMPLIYKDDWVPKESEWGGLSYTGVRFKWLRNFLITGWAILCLIEICPIICKYIN
jgi:hypothetical protein